jgi:hypothetical protein
MNRKTFFAAILLGSLAACTPKVITKTEIRTVRVPVRVDCPDATAYQGLKESRPVPLRTLPMPETPEERVAKSQAQLGRYEAEGGWADRVTVVLDRCQAEGLAPPNEIE